MSRFALFALGIWACGSDAAEARENIDVRLGQLERRVGDLEERVARAEQRAPGSELESFTVELPQAVQEPGNATSITIEVTASTLSIGGETVSRTQLRERLTELKRDNPEIEAVIAAEEHISHERVVEVMDAARAAGVAKLGIARRETKAKTAP